MKRILLLVLLVLAGVGFYLGWFHFSSKSSDGTSNITFTVDKDKIKEDERKAKEKVQDAGHDVKDKAAAAAAAPKARD